MNKYETKEYQENLARFCDESLHEKIPEPQISAEIDLEVEEIRTSGEQSVIDHFLN